MGWVSVSGTVAGLLAAAVVLLPAFSGFGRPAVYAWLGFICIIAGGAFLMLTPTPQGFDPAGASNRWLLSAGTGQVISAALFSAGAAGLLGAFAVGRNAPTTTEELKHTEL